MRRETPGLNPLPSFIRASALDAGNMHMRAGGRARWSEDDRNHAAATLDRLVRGTYGRPGDHNQPDRCFLRFQMVERLEREGKVKLSTDLAAVIAQLDDPTPEGTDGG